MKEENVILGLFGALLATAVGVDIYTKATETPKERKARLKREAAWAERQREIRMAREARESARREAQREKAQRLAEDPIYMIAATFCGERSDMATQKIIAEACDWDKQSLYRAYREDGVEFSEVQKRNIRKSFEGLSWGIR